MRQHVERGFFVVPFRTIEIVAVFGQRREVDNAEIRAVAGPCVRIVRRRFAKVVKACPHELAQYPVAVIVHAEIEVGGIRPRARLVVIAVAVIVGVHYHIMVLELDREVILATRRYSRGCLRAEDELLGQLFVSLVVVLGLVVEAGYVEGGSKTIIKHGADLVHTAGHGARGVEAVNQVLEHGQLLEAVGAPLAGNLVAD